MAQEPPPPPSGAPLPPPPERCYKHVRWWAKCEYGHIYSTLARLERRGHLRAVRSATDGGRGKQVYHLTAAGRRRVKAVLEQLGHAEDATYFDIDLFLSGAF